MGRRRVGLTQDIGHTGLNETWGIIQEDFLDEWRDTDRKVRQITEMLSNSPAVGALRLAIELSIRDIEWQFTDDAGEDTPRLQLLNDAWEAMSHSWNDHIQEACLMPFYGWSMFSIVYRRDGGRLLWRKFKMLGHDTVFRWQFAEDGGLAGLQQKPHLNPDPIPIERMLLYRFRKTKGNPEGESALRPAWIPWYYVKNLQQIEAIGIERNLAGLPVIHPPMGADMAEGSADYEAAHKVVRNVRQDEQAGVVMPAPVGEGEHQKWRLELLSGGGQSKVIDTDKVINRYDKRIFLSALSQFLMLGMDDIGALATFEAGTDFFTVAVNAVADIISETFTKFAIPRLLELNGFDADGVQLEHSPAGTVDVVEMSDALMKLSSMLTWMPDDEVMLREVLRLPGKTPEEIEQAQEEKRQRDLEDQERMLAARGPMPQGNFDTSVQTFAAENAPDDDERGKLERSWYGAARQYFSDAEKRLLKGVKG